MNQAARTRKSRLAGALVVLALVMLLSACGGNNEEAASGNGITEPVTASGNSNVSTADPSSDGAKAGTDNTGKPVTSTGPADSASTSAGSENPSKDGAGSAKPSDTNTVANGGSDSEGLKPNAAAATDPESIAVLINKQFGLPEGYEPQDLVYPDVPFTFKEKIEKRQMRKDAAGALEDMFAGAKKDGIYLAGVSGYRSHARQTAIFNNYVKRDGEEKAKTYSAVPGYSEHETGLSIDVSGSDGKCAAEDCFGDTKEAAWIAKHASEYGFIVRYPDGKEGITGFKYEPWHIRYVGKDVAGEIDAQGITLEEYYNAIPVSK